MKFSMFNFLFKSPKYGSFIYNSATNSFHKINDELFEVLETAKIDSNAIETIDKEMINKLIDLKIFVHQGDDESLINKRKYLSYSRSFSEKQFALVIVPTMFCNFACPYCYEVNLPNKKMSEDVQNKLIQFAESQYDIENKNTVICWHGGEPLTAFDVMVNILEKMYNSTKIRIGSHSLVTNGYLLNEERISILKKFKLNSIQITVDGMGKNHNESRPHKNGQPTFLKIIDNIDLLLHNFPECHVIIRTNIHNNNKTDFFELVNFINSRWDGFNYEIYLKYTTEHNNCKVECIRSNERVDFIEELSRRNVQNVKFYPTFKMVGCAAFYNSTYIVGVEGELYKCWVDVGKPERIIGTLDNPQKNLSLISEYMVGSDMFSDEECLKCFLFPVCDGGCNIIRSQSRLGKRNRDLCPIDTKKDIAKILELHYEQMLKNKVDTLV